MTVLKPKRKKRRQRPSQAQAVSWRSPQPREPLFIANITLMEFRAQHPACGGQYAADRWPHIASIRRAARSALIASISALAPARSPISAVNSRRVMSDMGLPPAEG